MKRLSLFAAVLCLTACGPTANQTSPAASGVQSPLIPGIYSGEMEHTVRTTISGQTSEETMAQSIPLVIGSTGIPSWEGVEEFVGRKTTMDLGGGVEATLHCRSVEVRSDGVIITSDMTTTDGFGGIVIATYEPAGQGSVKYTFDMVISQGTVSQTDHGVAILIKS